MEKYLLLGLFILGHVHHISGTACTSATEQTCRDTLFVKDECTSDKCECEDGYSATNEGCIETITPTVTIVGGLSGEAVAGNGLSFTLNCNPTDAGDGNYIWYEDNGVVNSENDGALSVAATTEAPEASYSCKINVNGYTTEASAGVPITVVAADGTISQAPVVTGMFTGSRTGNIVLTCSNVPLTTDAAKVVFSWTEDGNTVGSDSNTFTVAFSSTNLGKAYKCKITPQGSTFTVTNGESAAVTSPASVSTDVPSVSIDQTGPIIAFKGGNLKLNCAIGTFNPAGLSFTYENGGTPITGAITAAFEDNNMQNGDGGSYTCKAQGGTAVESTAVTVTYKDTDDAVTVDADVTAPVTDGCLYLRCDLKYPDLSGFTYIWTKGSATIFNQQDRTLQICPVDADSDGAYSCQAYNKGSTTAKSDDVTITEAAAIGTFTPAVNIPKSTTNYGNGESYTATCDVSAFWTPGITGYKWKEDDASVSETGSTYKFTLGTTTKKISCQATFNGADSAEGEQEIKTDDIKSIVSTTMVINALDGTSVSLGAALTPLSGKEITFKCMVTKASGASGSTSIKWLDDTKPITGQTSETYTATASSTIQTIKCQGELVSELEPSNAITVQEGTTLAVTSITLVSGEADKLSFGASYTFVCKTPFFSDSMTFKWTVDGSEVSNTKVYYTTSSLAKKEQVIKCDVTEGSETASATLTVKVGEPGLYCQYAIDCEETGYGGVCDTTSSRCTCASGYSADGAVCVNDSDDDGSIQVMASFTLLVAAFIFTKIM